jgi:putative transposase
MLTSLEEIFKQTCKKWECELKEFKGEPDPVHLLIDNKKKKIAILYKIP